MRHKVRLPLFDASLQLTRVPLCQSGRYHYEFFEA